MRPDLRFLLLLGLIMSSACSEATLTPIYGGVLVKVTDETGAPAAGARVELHSPQRKMATATTDQVGEFLFQYLPPGRYTAHLFPGAGYTIPLDDPFEPVPVEVQTGILTGVPLSLSSEAGRVRVHVVDLSGSPVPEVYLNLVMPDRVYRIATTPSSGVHVYESVHPGTYLLDWGAPSGFVASPDQPDPVLDIVVHDDATTEVTIRLARSD